MHACLDHDGARDACTPVEGISGEYDHMHLKLDARLPPIEKSASNLECIPRHVPRLNPQIPGGEVAVVYPLLEVHLDRLVLLVLDDTAERRAQT
jgi:hypothetical protein